MKKHKLTAVGNEHGCITADAAAAAADGWLKTSLSVGLAPTDLRALTKRLRQ